MPIILNRFWPIYDIEEKKETLKNDGFVKLKEDILASNTRRASSWSSLKNFFFFFSFLSVLVNCCC